MSFHFNPLTDDLSSLSDSQLEEKLRDLYRKYNMTSNAELQSQMLPIIEMFKSEQNLRLAKKQANDRNSDLDNLINID